MLEISLDELKDLMTFRGREGKELITNKYGGIENLCKKLNTDSENGIPYTAVDLKERKDKYGTNEIPLPPMKSFLFLVSEAMQDLTLIILIVSAIISLTLSFLLPKEDENVNDHNKHEVKSWIEGAAILIFVAVVVLVTALIDYTKERQFRDFQSKKKTDNKKIAVIRQGFEIEIPVDELVVGDIAQIKCGDVLPVDGIIIQSTDLRIDESSLTGESYWIRKSAEYDPMLLSGTNVMEGNGRMLVTTVGVHSQNGIIMTLLGAAADNKGFMVKQDFSDEANEENFSLKRKDNSILQAKLTNLAIKIGSIGLIIALSTIFILIFRFCFTKYYIDGNSFRWSDLRHFISFIIVGVTVLIVAVPEGLPLAVTLALAFSIQKMMKDNNLVRNINACETLANVTSILTVKTGTLTTNQMTVIQCHLADKFYKPGEPIQHPIYSKLLIEAICINSSYASKTLHPKIEGKKMTQIGNRIDCALLGYVLSLGQSYQKIRYQNPEDSFVKVYPFYSIRKYMGTVIKNAETGGYRVFVKGGAEIVLSRCKWFVGPDNTIEQFESFERKKILEDVIERMASLGLVVICIAYKDYVPKKTELLKNGIVFAANIDWDDEISVLEDLTCLAIVGIQNVVHPDVPEAILKCQKAGITVRMITDDNIHTAQSIAASCGILKPGEDDIVLEGKEFNNRIRDENGEFSQIKLDEFLPKLRVIARAKAPDKYILVKGIIDSTISFNCEVLAATGNGTNDGPALKKADVGFATGIAGSDVVKKASDIILTDDNFSSIVKAIIWSRNIYDSIAKFLQFQLTVNIVAVVVVFVGACVIQETPLKAIQMLWINLIMDTFASLAFTTEPPTEDILKRKPYNRTSPFISKMMLKNIVGHAIYQLIILFVLIFAGVKIFDMQSYHWTSPASQHFTIVFNTFVMMTLFNELNARKIHCERNIFEGLFSNPHFYCIWIFTFVFQILIVQFGGEWFSTAPLQWHRWLACLGFGVGTLLWGQILNCIPLEENLSDNIAVGSGSVVEHEDLLNLGAEDSFDEKHSRNMLWNRGEIKLRTQLRVVQAFQSFGNRLNLTVGVVNKADAKKIV